MIIIITITIITVLLFLLIITSAFVTYKQFYGNKSSNFLYMITFILTHLIATVILHYSVSLLYAFVRSHLQKADCQQGFIQFLQLQRALTCNLVVMLLVLRSSSI
jgi:hypothetical protein